HRDGRALDGAAALVGAIALAVATAFAARAYVLRSAPGGSELISLLDNPLIALGAPQRLAWAASLLGRYVVLAVWPLHLVPAYSFGASLWRAGLLAPGALAGFAAFAALLAAIAVGWRRDPRLALFGLWFLVAFGLTANALMAIGVGFAER